MGRMMAGGDLPAFRAAITWEYHEYIDAQGIRHDASSATFYHGPFATAGQAKSVITRERKQAARWPQQRGRTVTGKVQRTTTEWEDVA